MGEMLTVREGAPALPASHSSPILSLFPTLRASFFLHSHQENWVRCSNPACHDNGTVGRTSGRSGQKRAADSSALVWHLRCWRPAPEQPLGTSEWETSFPPSAFQLGELGFGRSFRPGVNLSSRRRAPVTQAQPFAVHRAIGSRQILQHHPSKTHAMTPISTLGKQIMSPPPNALSSMFASRESYDQSPSVKAHPSSIPCSPTLWARRVLIKGSFSEAFWLLFTLGFPPDKHDFFFFPPRVEAPTRARAGQRGGSRRGSAAPTAGAGSGWLWTPRYRFHSIIGQALLSLSDLQRKHWLVSTSLRRITRNIQGKPHTFSHLLSARKLIFRGSCGKRRQLLRRTLAALPDSSWATFSVVAQTPSRFGGKPGELQPPERQRWGSSTRSLCLCRRLLAVTLPPLRLSSAPREASPRAPSAHLYCFFFLPPDIIWILFLNKSTTKSN